MTRHHGHIGRKGNLARRLLAGAVDESIGIDFFLIDQRQGIAEWLPLWKANRWRTADRKAVKNEDLWRQLDTVASQHHIIWKWLKGHMGHPDNERCDQLAVTEIVRIRRNYSLEKLAALREAFVASRDPNRNQASLF